ncbi:aaRS-interacting multifunctional protein 1 [Oratosquilla oratoria]|uniref:aaRS-interacting multifunctional protein 1 n=1 Tax=Oratosquilla oratoria TaxID=337810 RepID=UPI003F76366C
MTTPEILNRLEQRAVEAEQMISELSKHIAHLQVVASDTHKQRLRKENEQLRQEVDQLKNRLVTLESSQGIQQFYDFSKKTDAATTDSTEPTKELSVNTTTVSNKQEKPQKEGKKKEKKEKGEGGDAGKKEQDLPVDVGRLDFRVGRIVTAKKHPDADALYVEEVDCGEDKIRTVVSGLVRFVPLEEMQNRMAVLLCNLKPAKMRGITSEAMVMCASTPEKVEILAPPAGSQPGDVVEFEGYTRNPDAILNPKKKIFETCAPDLKTDNNKVATYKGVPFTVPGKGVVVAPTLSGVQIK